MCREHPKSQRGLRCHLEGGGENMAQQRHYQELDIPPKLKKTKRREENCQGGSQEASSNIKGAVGISGEQSIILSYLKNSCSSYVMGFGVGWQNKRKTFTYSFPKENVVLV